jgi:hypothetical protein
MLVLSRINVSSQGQTLGSLACFARAHTLASPELQRVALLESSVVSAVRAQSWQGQVHSAIEG